MLQTCNDEFGKYIDDNVEQLQKHPCYIPFHAYIYGISIRMRQKHRCTKGIFYWSGGAKKYNDTQVIHRELL